MSPRTGEWPRCENGQAGGRLNVVQALRLHFHRASRGILTLSEWTSTHCRERWCASFESWREGDHAFGCVDGGDRVRGGCRDGGGWACARRDAGPAAPRLIESVAGRPRPSRALGASAPRCARRPRSTRDDRSGGCALAGDRGSAGRGRARRHAASAASPIAERARGMPIMARPASICHQRELEPARIRWIGGSTCARPAGREAFRPAR
jgi:hypothetical protein